MAWAGHLDVYERQQNSKQNFNTKLDGVRRVGRLKMRWEDGVDQDMRILEVKNWKKVTLERDEWAKLLKKTRAHQGLSSQWWWWWWRWCKHYNITILQNKSYNWKANKHNLLTARHFLLHQEQYIYFTFLHQFCMQFSWWLFIQH